MRRPSTVVLTLAVAFSVSLSAQALPVTQAAPPLAVATTSIPPDRLPLSQVERVWPPPRDVPAAPVDSGKSSSEVAPAAEDSFSIQRTLPDGRVEVELSTAPLTRSSGKSRELVDTTVRKGSDKHPLAAERAVRPVRFGADARTLVELGLDRGPVTVSGIGLTAGVPALAADGAVIYRDVATDTDLEYHVGSSQVKEEIVLRSKRAPTSFTFHLADSAGQLGEAVRSEEGGWSFAGRQGDLALSIPPAVAYERAASASANTPARSAPTRAPALLDSDTASLSVERAGDGFNLTVAVKPEWLAGKKFPIVLDPTIVFSPANGAVYDATGTTGTPCNNGTSACRLVEHVDLRVGPQVELNYMWRSYLRFNLASIPKYSTVQSATFSWQQEWGGTTGRTLELHRIQSSWNKYSSGQAIAAATDPAAAATGVHTQRDYDLTALAQGWINGTVATTG